MNSTMISKPERRSSVSIQTADFDVSQELQALRQGLNHVGALCVFVGTVRDRQAGRQVEQMQLEHYPGMTEKSIQAMIEQAFERFDVLGVRVVHRVGLLALADQVVMVAVSAEHRAQSFLACEFLMDYLKTHAPFWKKESTTEGSLWVDARVSDDQAMQRWGIEVNNAQSSN